ncbi:hypothetical protein [Pseudothauera lacus]|uniref:Lipoprotein n=1 Tax=Pseudothauera lacus TaxID=2136175 RepID=A0A2T4IHQ5_9RHOO|nr:hypothetical protein [Pseudothauera lacus]PTD97309.1 hypothetical protein C8261_04685 [Pseudothauera lacus]
MIRLLLSAASALLLAACTTYPLGIPEREWVAMDAEQRLAARLQQAELDRALAQRRAAEAQAREASAAQQAAELAARRAEAAPGERIQCVLREVQARLQRRWRPAMDVALDLVDGHAQSFIIEEGGERRGRYRSTAHARVDGQTLWLCRNPPGVQPSARECASVVATFEEYRRGVVQSVEAPDVLRARVRCDLVADSRRALRRH